jgi:transposase
VKPYVKSNKNDARDAEAIWEAVSRPNMRFAPVKTPAQQAVLSLHRARQGFIKARTVGISAERDRPFRHRDRSFRERDRGFRRNMTADFGGT